MIESPNWCMNTLTVTGDEESLNTFKERVRGTDSDLSLETLRPTPPELLDEEAFPLDKDNPNRKLLIEKYGAEDWYSWRLANWGCKWDVDARLEQESDTHLLYRFESPWGPPEEGMRYVSEQVPGVDLVLEYDEPGMDFWGVISFSNGEGVELDSGPSQINAAWAEENEDEDEDVEDVPLDEE